MKIPLNIIPTAYKTSKKVYEGKMTLSEGTKHIAKEGRMNRGSAHDYIYNFRYLIQGKKFSRTLNASTMEYFFANFLKDYGSLRLENPLSALMQHIEYYEGKRNTTMHSMRGIYKKYSELANVLKFITNEKGLTRNINTIENYLTAGTDTEKLEASKLIKRGTCFVAYRIGSELRFAPSRFLGYENNALFKYSAIDIDGRETNKVINEILKPSRLRVRIFEQQYLDYCSKLGIKPQIKGGAFGVKRKYWSLNLDQDFPNNIEIDGEFPEGKIVERIHKVRERNSQVVELAKQNFKKRHGKLFCQVCNFDFEKTYGKIGEDFVEGHHTIAVSDMPPNYKTKPEEIAVLCSNCHRMVHKRRPWLTMEQLSKLLKIKK